MVATHGRTRNMSKYTSSFGGQLLSKFRGKLIEQYGHEVLKTTQIEDREYLAKAYTISSPHHLLHIEASQIFEEGSSEISRQSW